MNVMLHTIIRRPLAGLLTLCVCWLAPGPARADDPALMGQLNRPKLSSSFRNTGTQGAGLTVGAWGENSASMCYPYNWTGTRGRGLYGSFVLIPQFENENSRGEGVWIFAKDASGRRHISASGPLFISEDIREVVPDFGPGGNMKLSNGDQHPFAKAGLGFETRDATVWFNSDKGGPARTVPGGPTPAVIANYREKGDYTLPRFDPFPEETVVSRWRSDETLGGTGMTFTRYAYGWSHPDFDDFFIVELVAENTSKQTYDEVYVAYLNYFDVSLAGGAWALSGILNSSDDRYQYTESSNYAGPYRGKKVSYQYDGDHPDTPIKDLGNPYVGVYVGATSANGLPIPQRGEGELLSPQYVGWGPVDLTPPFINDPEVYVPLPGTAAGGLDLPADQPRYSHWWSPSLVPDITRNNRDQMWEAFITPASPIDNNPIKNGPRQAEQELQGQLHTQVYGPWSLKPGEKAKIVLVFAAGAGNEFAGPGGEPLDWRLWTMSSGAPKEVASGEKALFDHIERGRLLYRMGYDLPNQPPDLESKNFSFLRPDQAVQLASNGQGNIAISWLPGADNAAHPDFGDKDVAGYRVYRNTSFLEKVPVVHQGNNDGPWKIVAEIRAGDSKYLSGGRYTYTDEGSLTGFEYRYNVAPFGKGHNTWENRNAQNNSIPGAQRPVPTTLADLPAIVQRHVKAGVSASYIVDPARSSQEGRQFPAVIAASAASDALQNRVKMVPNPWRDDGIHNFGPLGSNNRRVRFINLPRMARVSIYNAAGDLQTRIVHQGAAGTSHSAEMEWDLRPFSGVGSSGVPPGMYFFVVESLVPGEFEKRKVQTGSFMVIQ